MRNVIEGAFEGVCFAIAAFLFIIFVILMIVNIQLLIVTFIVGVLLLIAAIGAGFKY